MRRADDAASTTASGVGRRSAASVAAKSPLACKRALGTGARQNAPLGAGPIVRGPSTRSARSSLHPGCQGNPDVGQHGAQILVRRVDGDLPAGVGVRDAGGQALAAKGTGELAALDGASDLDA